MGVANTEGFFACNQIEQAFEWGNPEGAGADGFNCDPDCGAVDDECTTIPLDGGLSLLALAGGGLATAAMRRRREEEEASQLGA